MSKYNVETLPVDKLYLGEGPHWDEKNQQLFYVDILDKGIQRFVPATGEKYKVTISKLFAKSSIYFNLESSIVLYSNNMLI